MARTFKVEITATAEADVADIWDYIAQDNPKAASAFVLRLEDQLEKFEEFPERCPRIAEIGQPAALYRHLIIGHYRAIFRIEGDKVIVLRVPHSVRLLDPKMVEGRVE